MFRKEIGETTTRCGKPSARARARIGFPSPYRKTPARRQQILGVHQVVGRCLREFSRLVEAAQVGEVESWSLDSRREQVVEEWAWISRHD
jgi:hypothetical protein